MGVASSTFSLAEGFNSAGGILILYTRILCVKREGVTYSEIPWFQPFTKPLQFKQAPKTGKITFEIPGNPGGEKVHVIYKT